VKSRQGQSPTKLSPVRIATDIWGYRRLKSLLQSDRPEDTSSVANQPPLAFGIKQAEHPHMTPRAQRIKPTAGALRASRAIQNDASLLKSLPELIDHETGVREILDILQSIIAQAGDLIESRSPELLAAARAALTRYNDEALGQAE
jgi:hypothetical protein